MSKNKIIQFPTKPLDAATLARFYDAERPIKLDPGEVEIRANKKLLQEVFNAGKRGLLEFYVRYIDYDGSIKSIILRRPKSPCP